MSNPKIAEVAVNLPVKDSYHYYIPDNLKAGLEVGMRVWVSFGRQRIIGYVIDIIDKSDVPKIKPIISIIDKVPIITPDLLKLAIWISQYYYTSLGEALSICVPSPLKSGKTKIAKRSEWELDYNPKVTKPAFLLNPDQNHALELIHSSLTDNKFKVFLLHGITGSGKTEIYIRAIEEALRQKKSSIVLVPEIALTPQTVERFHARFGKLVAVMHSRMAGSEKFYNWQNIKEGKCPIIVGPRSAIFAPSDNVGLVIVDEEHETSYKQEDAPRYNAVDVACERARLNNATVILGSATPSLESFYLAKKNIYTLIELPERVDKRPLPQVEVVDMSQGMFWQRGRSVFSYSLENNIRKTLSDHKQVILFLNRRGFSTYINCAKCGYVLKCGRCSVTMTYHFDKGEAVCHYCNTKVIPPKICPQCQASYFRYFGMGTQKVESELHRLFPEANICRMDSDSTIKRGSHGEIFYDFKDRKTDILIGTQMLAKGLDFPDVTLVGVIFADVTMNLPDFRASERTFALLTQVAGRAGRGSNIGRVVVQTNLPAHYAIMASATHDYQQFYDKEIKFRSELSLPPFNHIIEVMIRGKDEQKVKNAAEDLYKIMRDILSVKAARIVGPAPAPVYKVRRNFRWQILLYTKNPLILNKTLKKVFSKFRRPSGMHLVIDVDPR